MVWRREGVAHPDEATEHVANPRKLRHPVQRCVEKRRQDRAGKEPLPVAAARLPWRWQRGGLAHGRTLLLVEMMPLLLIAPLSPSVSACCSLCRES